MKLSSMQGIVACLTIFLALVAPSNAMTEADHQEDWCPGQQEVKLKDLTRVDCLTDTYAIEIEWARIGRKLLANPFTIP